MKISLTTWEKVLIAVLCFALAVIGFMVKLPAGFRRIDKELHTIFYFLAAALLNGLFVSTKIVKHCIVFITLFLFGVAIECGQQYSNKFFKEKIHGRFDPQDIQSNLNGLIAFSLLWLLFTVVILDYRIAKLKRADTK